MKKMLLKFRNAGLFLIFVLCKPFLPVVVRLFFGDVWRLKATLQRRNGALRGRIYTDYMRRSGAYIGVNSVFREVPTFPHEIFGIFISDKAVVGRGAVIFHQVTIGSNTIPGSKGFGSPEIGDNVYIGAGAKIIGGVKIGSNVRIGANAVVVKDIPDNATVVAAPCLVYVKDAPNDNRYTRIQDAKI